MSVDFAVQHGYPRSLFLPIRMEAQSTVDEARAMGPIFQRLGAKRIILVTNNFHSRRAAQVFRLFLPEFDFRMEAAPDGVFDPAGLVEYAATTPSLVLRVSKNDRDFPGEVPFCQRRLAPAASGW